MKVKPIFYWLVVGCLGIILSCAVVQSQSTKNRLRIQLVNAPVNRCGNDSFSGPNLRVLITNELPNVVKVLDESPSCLSEDFSLEFTDENEHVFLVRRVHLDLPNSGANSTRPIVSIAPGDLVLQCINLTDGSWSGFSGDAQDPFLPGKYSVRVLLQAPADSLHQQLGLWTGSAVSKAVSWTFEKPQQEPMPYLSEHNIDRENEFQSGAIRTPHAANEGICNLFVKQPSGLHYYPVDIIISGASLFPIFGWLPEQQLGLKIRWIKRIIANGSSSYYCPAVALSNEWVLPLKIWLGYTHFYAGLVYELIEKGGKRKLLPDMKVCRQHFDPPFDLPRTEIRPGESVVQTACEAVPDTFFGSRSFVDLSAMRATYSMAPIMDWETMTPWPEMVWNGGIATPEQPLTGNTFKTSRSCLSSAEKSWCSIFYRFSPRLEKHYRHYHDELAYEFADYALLQRLRKQYLEAAEEAKKR